MNMLAVQSASVFHLSLYGLYFFSSFLFLFHITLISLSLSDRLSGGMNFVRHTISFLWVNSECESDK